jgi:hypothetical protein
MSETTPSSEPTTGPIGTAAPAGPATSTPVAEREHDRRPSRLNVVAAWVGIVAGTVFIVAVIFFTGFVLGAHAGGHHRGGGHGDDRGGAQGYHQGPPMGPMFRPGRGFIFPGGPGGFPGAPGTPSGPGSSSTSPTPPGR